MCISCVEINVAIIAACMSTLPGVLALATRYGSSVFKSFRSRIRGSRSGTTVVTSSNGTGKARSNTDEAFTAGVSRKKTAENINYIQLEEGAHSGASTERPSNSENQPLWGRRWEKVWNNSRLSHAKLDIKKFCSFCSRKWAQLLVTQLCSPGVIYQ